MKKLFTTIATLVFLLSACHIAPNTGSDLYLVETPQELPAFPHDAIFVGLDWDTPEYNYLVNEVQNEIQNSQNATNGNGSYNQGGGLFYLGMDINDAEMVLDMLNLESQNLGHHDPNTTWTQTSLGGETPRWTDHLGSGRLVRYYYTRSDDGVMALSAMHGHVVCPRGLRVGDSFDRVFELYNEEHQNFYFGAPPELLFNLGNILVGFQGWATYPSPAIIRSIIIIYPEAGWPFQSPMPEWELSAY